MEQTRRQLTEPYALCRRNQDKIPVAKSEKTAPGLGFTLLITQLPANANLVKLVFPNPNYNTQLKNTAKPSPCPEPE